jgi:hypothetical protein
MRLLRRDVPNRKMEYPDLASKNPIHALRANGALEEAGQVNRHRMEKITRRGQADTGSGLA